MSLPSPARRCPNCEAEAPRRYCPECGQDQERSIRVSLGTLLPDAVEQAVSLDSRFGRTFGRLLFRPGRVTAEYLEGRRARYSSPVNVYLLASFLFFLAEALAPEGRGPVQVSTSQAREEAAQALGEARRDAPPEARAALDAAGEVASAGGGLRGAEQAETWLRARRWPGPPLADRVHVLRQLPPAEASRRLQAAFAQAAPRVLFFLVPVMALLLKLLWPRRFYAEHLVFSLHAQSLAFLSFVPGLFLPVLAGPLFLAALAWSALALRRVYGGAWPAVLAKGAALFVALSIALGIGLAVTAAVAFVSV